MNGAKDRYFRKDNNVGVYAANSSYQTALGQAKRKGGEGNRTEASTSSDQQNRSGMQETTFYSRTKVVMALG
ncbi:hypothetical protein ACH5RR_026301 [Cinchona calisaya]|uniref:Uncharacterized protein n=1 Tax=Cinchona calisaya TaxID=153742 RepID=A0ABD2Z261_9GENT